MLRQSKPQRRASGSVAGVSKPTTAFSVAVPHYAFDAAVPRCPLLRLSWQCFFMYIIHTSTVIAVGIRSVFGSNPQRFGVNPFPPSLAQRRR